MCVCVGVVRMCICICVFCVCKVKVNLCLCVKSESKCVCEVKIRQFVYLLSLHALLHGDTQNGPGGFRTLPVLPFVIVAGHS